MNPEDKKHLLELQPFHRKQYENIALTSLLAYCAYWLQEWKIAGSKENLTVAAFKMFPTKFSMVDWPEYPDKERVNRTILQMRPKYRNLATSVADKGVYLNSNGLREATALIARLGRLSSAKHEEREITPDDLRAERGGRPRSIHSEDQIARLKKSHLYQLYAAGDFDETEAIDLNGMLGVYDHTPSVEKRVQLKLLIDAAADLNDKEVMGFLSQVEKHFSSYLNRE
jgi:hypothetical protein